jgi:Mitotic checkpoint protein
VLHAHTQERNSSEVVATLRKELAETRQSAEIRRNRLKEVCQQKIGEFREAVYEILGYQVDVLPGRT